MENLPKCQANYTPLTPLTFLSRAASSYAHRTSIIHDGASFTWSQTYDRCRRLASSLRSLHVAPHDVVSVLAPNIPAMYEMHFAVPMAGAVLNTINTRLDANNIATILKHSEAKVFFVDYEYVPKAGEALRILMESNGGYSSLPLVIVIDDISSPTGVRMNDLDYELLIRRGDPNFVPLEPNDEWAPIALNYTSGTTSAPKGVVYSHRGAYLSTLSLILCWEVPTAPVYLWTLPMFHCNGWTFTWGVAARGGTNVCLRNITASQIFNNIALHNVTHMCCAPIIFNIMLQAKPAERHHPTSTVEILTGGAPPPAALLQQIESLGFHVTHAYGLTEATGPALVCEWDKKWNDLPKEEQSKLKARQGVSILTLAGVDVKNLETMESVPRDGKTMGEIVLRGSGIMKGYYKDPEETSKVFQNGWFRTGDVGVVHPDGYLEIKDRSKDVIISGGENISSVEVENVLYKHPRVSEAAVVAIMGGPMCCLPGAAAPPDFQKTRVLGPPLVAMPHPKWGESPCAFIALKKNESEGKKKANDDAITKNDIIGYCRKRMSCFMVPKVVKFMDELPKTSTGKILKVELREKAKAFVVSDDVQGTTSSSSDRVDQNEDNSKGGGHYSEHVLALSRL